MKAIVKFTKKIIDVQKISKSEIYPRIYKDVRVKTYVDPDLEILDAPEEMTKMYVARNESGELRLHFLKPTRANDDEKSGFWGGPVGMSTIISSNLFPSLDWLNEPLEVYINIIPRKKI